MYIHEDAIIRLKMTILAAKTRAEPRLKRRFSLSNATALSHASASSTDILVF